MIGLYLICYIITLSGYKLFGFELCVIGLLTIIAFNSSFLFNGAIKAIDKEFEKGEG